MCAPKVASEKLSKAFKKGLKEKYEMTIEDLDDWRYCGGNRNRHYRYWKLQYGDTPVPEMEVECVCYHPIKEQCYITNGEELLVLGNCCIQKFVAKCTRTCERCGDPHKNRIINRCNNCRVTSGWCSYTCKNIGICKKGKERCNPDFEMCHICCKYWKTFWEEFGQYINSF